MEYKFKKYKNTIIGFYTEFDINKYLTNHLIKDIFTHEIIMKITQSKEKVSVFFDEFDGVNNDKKYENFIKITKETSDWIEMCFTDSAEQSMKDFRLFWDFLTIQIEDCKKSLLINEVLLHDCLSIDLISDVQHSELAACLNEHGEENTKIRFLSTIFLHSKNWLGKLLFVYYKYKTKFIPDFIPELQTELDKLNTEEEKKEFIFQYGDSIIETNKNAFKISSDEETPVKSQFDKELQKLHDKDDRKNYIFQYGNKENAIDRNMGELKLEFGNLTCDWINSFVKNPQEAEDSRKKFEMMFDLFRIQNVDHIDSLYLDDKVLFQCRNLKYITDTEFDEMQVFLREKGLINAKIKFLLMMSNKGPGWYGKILHIFDIVKTKFIHDYLPDLDKDLNQIQINSERKDYIYAYANSILEQNQNQFKKSETDKFKEQKIESMEFDLAIETSNDEVKMECIESDTKQLYLPGCNSNQSTNEFLGLDDDLKSLSIAVNRSSPDSGLLKDETSSSDSEVADENIEFDDLFGQLHDKTVQELLHFSPPPQNVQPMASSPLEIRDYQRELAEHGIGGKNVLICSPTGSGKTIVAVKIVQEHLKNTANAKVAFLVHRIALVEQQYNQFVKYLDCKITRLTGSSKSLGAPFVGHLKSFQVFVLTSDILRNALEEESETKLPSLNVFSLILFDECHNCDKKHPYNRIMNHYFKLKKSGSKHPQIIGLTASTGTNKAGTMDKALKRLFQLCANLDTYIVSTVKEFKNELEMNQSKPLENVITPDLRSSDQFDIELQKLMQLCERMLLEMNIRGFFPKDPNTQAIFTIPEDRLHHKYLGFVGKLNTELYNVSKEENDGRKAVFAISNYLNAFVRALMVNHLFRAQDAVKLIKDSLGLEKEVPTMCKVESILKKRLKAISKYEKQEHSENPCLKCLKDQIIKQIEENKASRIIVFVKERNYTKILKSIFSEVKPNINCEIVVGNTISAEQGGLTQNELEDILGRFRRGEVSVLFSTTVAEEGLDIQKCNLVIRYGHVTNETAMVQSRGRARASDSKYIVIVPNKLQWQVHKENINKYRESMMYRAIEKFQEMSEDRIRHEIEECQCERELQETCEKFKSRNSKLSTSSVWNFNCKKCSMKICKSTDVRVAERAHHIVINEECFQYMKAAMAANQTSCQILCKNCSSILGNRQNYKNRLLPSIKIDSFSLVCEETASAPRSFKKWKDVPFAIAECSFTELLNFRSNNSLAI